MIITHLGKQAFKITQGDITLSFNPVSKESKSGIKQSKFGADIVFVTTNHPDYNGTDSAVYGDAVPFIIDSAGDYEVKGIFIKGINSKITLEGNTYINTIYTLVIDGISLCFLGAIDKSSVTSEVRSMIEDVDVLFIPVGGDDLIDAEDAYKLAVSFEPRIIIPMDYDGKKGMLTTFLKEGGQEDVKVEEKLTLKRKDLDGKQGTIIVLEA